MAPYIILGILIVFVGLSFTKFEIKEKVEINAPIEKVWSAIIDFESYHLWNTQLEYLGGEVKPNGQLNLRLSAEGTTPYAFKPTISHWKENEKFAWLSRTGLPRVFDGEHFFELTKTVNNSTLVTNREEYRGVLSLVIKNLPMMKNAAAGFQKMNRELKNYIENKK